MDKNKTDWTRYNSNYQRYTVKLHKQNDADIIALLELDNVQPYALIKQLLRDYAAFVRGCGSWPKEEK